MQDVEDKIRGMVVGAVVGDALGMPLEFHPPRSLYDLATEMEDGPLPAGTFTDDTEMALAVAESLLEKSPLDSEDLTDRFVQWYKSRPSDVGIHTSRVLELIQGGMTAQQAAETVQSEEPDSAGNGSLMRAWPIAAARWNNPGLLVAESRLQSGITHPHPDCLNSCVLLNLILAALFKREEHQSPDETLRNALANALEQVTLDETFALTIHLAPVRQRENLKNTGWVRHTLESALWGTLTTQSFEEALIKVVNLGRDADTAGCVAGAIAGSMYGLSGIPVRWKDAIHGEYPLRSGRLWFLQDFIRLADELGAMSA